MTSNVGRKQKTISKLVSKKHVEHHLWHLNFYEKFKRMRLFSNVSQNRREETQH